MNKKELKRTIDMAIECSASCTLKMESLQIMSELLDRDISKKPEPEEYWLMNNKKLTTYVCPKCGEEVIYYNDGVLCEMSFCTECGQRLEEWEC